MHPLRVVFSRAEPARYYFRTPRASETVATDRKATTTDVQHTEGVHECGTRRDTVLRPVCSGGSIAVISLIEHAFGHTHTHTHTTSQPMSSISELDSESLGGLPVRLGAAACLEGRHCQTRRPRSQHQRLRPSLAPIPHRQPATLSVAAVTVATLPPEPRRVSLGSPPPVRHDRRFLHLQTVLARAASQRAFGVGWGGQNRPPERQTLGSSPAMTRCRSLVRRTVSAAPLVRLVSALGKCNKAHPSNDIVCQQLSGGCSC